MECLLGRSSFTGSGCARFPAGKGRRTGRAFHAVVALMMAVPAVITGCGPSTPPGVTLNVNTEPLEGATVKFNGDPVGQSPVTIPDVQPGKSLVEVELEGYHSEWKTVSVTETPAEQSVTLTMRKLEGTVTIESKPTNATVVLDDGTVLGDTPLVNAKIPAGKRTIRVEYENYEPSELTFEIEPDFVYTKAFELKPKNGKLHIFSFPTASSYWLNNRKQAKKTPVSLDLIPGTYRVGVHAPGYVMEEQVIELAANDERTLEFNLKEGAVPEGMVLVPAGEFTMGVDDESPDERPARTIMVEAFYIDKYEVTNAEFHKVFPTHRFKKGEEQFPVAGVTWEQATAYARAVNKRLPTEIEWEKAARGEDGRTWPWGNEFDPAYCNFATGNAARPHEVGSYPEGISPYGCFDMAGNVREWTQSWYEAYPGNTDVTAEYGQVYRVLRGGSYLSGSFDVRTVRRSFERMDVAEPDFGFRCAADVAS